MHTTAHPDDEHGGLLAWLSRGTGARVSLMTLNRGQSGDNALGPQLFDGLGLIRTEELLVADQYYGVDAQYFTTRRSTTASRSGSKKRSTSGAASRCCAMSCASSAWSGRWCSSRVSRATSATATAITRRPGVITVQAFRAAGDPKIFPEQIAEGLRAWQPLKVYIGGMREDEDWTRARRSRPVQPVAGHVVRAISPRVGLSFQRSQNSGRLSLAPGPQLAYYKRVDTVPSKAQAAGEGEDREETFFDGIDTSLAGLFKTLRRPEPAGAAARLQPIAQAVDEAIQQFSVTIRPRRCRRSRAG